MYKEGKQNNIFLKKNHTRIHIIDEKTHEQ